MAKDYGRKSNGRQTRNASSQFLLILASFLGGYLTASVFDFSSLSTWVNKQMLATKNNQTGTVTAKKTEAPKPKFEFYTLLAKDSSTLVPVAKIPAPSAAAVQVAIQKPTQAPATTTQLPGIETAVTESKNFPTVKSTGRENYLLQVASFNKQTDAEHLKASLVLRGYDVTISPISRGQITWFRVIMGPFPSKISAEKAQNVVAQTERMHGMIRRVG